MMSYFISMVSDLIIYATLILIYINVRKKKYIYIYIYIVNNMKSFPMYKISLNAENEKVAGDKTNKIDKDNCSEIDFNSL